MQNKNDTKIKKILEAVTAKKKDLGTKPSGALKTNGLLTINSNRVNINTVNSIEKVVELAAELLSYKSSYEEACELMGIPKKENPKASNIQNSLDDLKLRASIIKYDAEKKKLAGLEKQLKDLRSEDGKTSDELADISSMLDL